MMHILHIIGAIWNEPGTIFEGTNLINALGKTEIKEVEEHQELHPKISRLIASRN